MNGDGVVDLLGHFRAGDVGLSTADDRVCLCARTLAGVRVQGCDSSTLVEQDGPT